MSKNPHFRILALTATPGGTPEAVQALVDSLHISRIEIRNEDSLDLKPYLHKKVFGSAFIMRVVRELILYKIMKQHTVLMDEHVLAVRDHLVKVMDVCDSQVPIFSG
jgi:ATP-dependent DNA helicase MPH1